MGTNPGLRLADPISGRRRGARLLAGLGALGLAIPLVSAGEDRGSRPPGSTRYYSTAPAPRDYIGPRPILLALNDPTASRLDIEQAVDRQVVRAQEIKLPPAQEKNEVPRVASTVGHSPAPAAVAAPDPVAQAKQAIADCQARFRQVHDYTCTFQKRELVDGRLTAPHIMLMKARNEPSSIYFKFQSPNRGREAIFVNGRNGGKIVAHDVGFGKLLAGTMHLDPKGSMAMEDNRHPVTEAGIGNLIETIARRWTAELTPEESLVSFHPDIRVGSHPCTMIESIHPKRQPNFLFHMVKVYIDHEHGLPVRFEAYDWPRHAGATPVLVEEYSYLNLRVNVGLREHDFDPANKQYSFGRF